MAIADVRELVQYVTNVQGKTTGVLVPLDVWEELLKSWQALADELGQIDEAEPIQAGNFVGDRIAGEP